MSVAEHIAAEQALLLIALEDDDPEKVAALSHAAVVRGLLAPAARESGDVPTARRGGWPPGQVLEARVHAAVLAPQPAVGFARLERGSFG